VQRAVGGHLHGEGGDDEVSVEKDDVERPRGDEGAEVRRVGDRGEDEEGEGPVLEGREVGNV
jgi:hypothetical protein